MNNSKDKLNKVPLVLGTTSSLNNSFEDSLNLQVQANGTLRPVSNPKMADYRCKIKIEYPTYQEELEIKKLCTEYDETHAVHYIDQESLTEWRVRRCLADWNLHDVVPGLTGKLIRMQGKLEDKSMERFKSLPPLIRKRIIDKINRALGSY